MDYQADMGLWKDACIALARLAGVMARLRAPDGCSWDREQTWETIAPYTIEEAYEVADAIARADVPELREELGDLALQVVYHAQIGAEAGAFTLADVLNGIADKMVRRHPHVFGSVDAHDAASVEANWDAIKAAEKPAGRPLEGVAVALPALMRAQKLAKRAAAAGIALPEALGTDDLAALPSAERESAAGILLLQLAASLREAGVDAETALRRACDRLVEQAGRLAAQE
jgi:ATP diphosphatase